MKKRKIKKKGDNPTFGQIYLDKLDKIVSEMTPEQLSKFMGEAKEHFKTLSPEAQDMCAEFERQLLNEEPKK